MRAFPRSFSEPSSRTFSDTRTFNYSREPSWNIFRHSPNLSLECPRNAKGNFVLSRSTKNQKYIVKCMYTKLYNKIYNFYVLWSSFHVLRQFLTFEWVDITYVGLQFDIFEMWQNWWKLFLQYCSSALFL